MASNKSYQKAYGDMFKGNDMLKAFSEFKTPNLDMNGLMTTGRKNAEALSAVSQMMMEDLQAVTRRQTELLQESVEGFLEASRSIFNSKTPETNTKKQADFARSAYENSVASSRELSEMLSKSWMKAFDVINERASKTVTELSQVAKAAA